MEKSATIATLPAQPGQLPAPNPGLGSGAGLRWFWGLTGVVTLLKVLYLYQGPDLFSEEAQYWLWSRHIDWAYYSKPPLVALVNYVSTGLFGVSAATIRFNAILCGVGISYYLFRLGIEQFCSYRVALLAVILLNVSPFFVTASLFFTTDSLLMFCWAAALYHYLRYKRTNQPVDVWSAYGFVTLGMLAKPTMLLFGIVLLVAHYRQPALLGRRLAGFGAAVLIGLLPSLVWNSRHDWVTVRHIIGLAGGAHQSLLSENAVGQCLEFVGGQVAYASIFVVAWVVLVRPWQIDPVAKSQLQPLWLVPGLVLAGFSLLSLHTRVEVNWPSATMVSWPLAMAYLLWLRYRQSPAAFRIAWPVGLSAIVLLLLLHPTWLDTVAGRPVIPVPLDPFNRLAGWHETGKAVSRFVGNLPADQYAIMSDSYHIAAELAFYVDGQPDTYCLPNPHRRLNQFDFWPLPSVSQQQHLVYISDNPMSAEIRRQLGPVERAQVWPVYYRSALVRTMYIYLALGYRPDPALQPVGY